MLNYFLRIRLRPQFGKQLEGSGLSKSQHLSPGKLKPIPLSNNVVKNLTNVHIRIGFNHDKGALRIPIEVLLCILVTEFKYCIPASIDVESISDEEILTGNPFIKDSL